MTNSPWTTGVASKAVEGEVEKSSGLVMDWRREPGWNTLEDLLGIDRIRDGFSTALRTVAFVACIDVIAQDIAKVPMRLYRRDPSGGRRLVQPNAHPLARLLALDPNDYFSWSELLHMHVFHVGLYQNGYFVKRERRDGELLALLPVMSSRVKMHVTKRRQGAAARAVYQIARGTNYEDMVLAGLPDRLSARQVIHTRLRLFDGMTGLSNLSVGAGSMDLSSAVNGFMTNLYERDGQVRGVFESEGTVTDVAFNRLREQLDRQLRALARGEKPLITEGGLKFRQISLDAQDADVIKARQASIEEMCRLTRVPPHKIMHLAAVKYENLDGIERTYTRDTLLPIAQRIEVGLERSLLSEEERLNGYFLELDRQQMMFADPEAQQKLLEMDLRHGAITVNEYRERRGYNPETWGDVRVLGSGMTTLAPDENGASSTVGDTQDADDKTLRVIEGGR